MATTYSHGLKVNGVLIGAIANDGGAGTVLTSPGKVREDTINVNPASNTDTEFFAQGDTSPVIIVTKKGVKEGQFDLLTFDPEVIADLTGGTTTGAGVNMLYHESTEPTNVRKTLKFIDAQGNEWLYPHVKLNADLVGMFRTGDVNVVRVQFKVLAPTKAGVASFTYGKPEVA